jgi:hypothetical protein
VAVGIGTGPNRVNSFLTYRTIPTDEILETVGLLALVGCWLGRNVDDPVGTFVGVVLGTTKSLKLGCWLGVEERHLRNTSFLSQLEPCWVWYWA